MASPTVTRRPNHIVTGFLQQRLEGHCLSPLVLEIKIFATSSPVEAIPAAARPRPGTESSR